MPFDGAVDHVLQERLDEGRRIAQIEVGRDLAPVPRQLVFDDPVADLADLFRAIAPRQRRTPSGFRAALPALPCRDSNPRTCRTIDGPARDGKDNPGQGNPDEPGRRFHERILEPGMPAGIDRLQQFQ